MKQGAEHYHWLTAGGVLVRAGLTCFFRKILHEAGCCTFPWGFCGGTFDCFLVKFDMNEPENGVWSGAY